MTPCGTCYRCGNPQASAYDTETGRWRCAGECAGPDGLEALRDRLNAEFAKEPGMYATHVFRHDGRGGRFVRKVPPAPATGRPHRPRTGRCPGCGKKAYDCRC